MDLEQLTVFVLQATLLSQLKHCVEPSMLFSSWGWMIKGKKPKRERFEILLGIMQFVIQVSPTHLTVYELEMWWKVEIVEKQKPVFFSLQMCSPFF